MEEMIQCPQCKENKSRSEFPQKRIQWNSPCRGCIQKRARLHARNTYWRHVDRYRPAAKKREAERRKSAPESCLLSSARARAKKKGMLCTLTKDDIQIPKRCPVLGLKLVPLQKRGSTLWDCVPSIDRLDNTKGYTPENCFVISRRANMLKNTGTAEEHERIAEWLGELESNDEC